MLNDKNKRIIKIVATCLIIILVVWFLILSPILKFKSEEKEVLSASQRYFEVNQSQLPTGTRIKTITLKTLYNKDFIKTDLLVPNSSKTCNEKESFVKVKKINNEYKYYVYLKCGVFKSNIDHEGPVITLKGDEEITLNKGDKYKDAGIEKVVDNTDGKMNIKDVKVDTSKVNTNKNGTYQVTYKIKDSFENETIKIRTVKVVQILDKIVKKETDKSNIYKGSNDNNFVMIDGILFKIVGLNSDGSVKMVSNDNLAAVNYDGVDAWLNDYFYNKLSDSAKKLIVEEKWCNDKVTNPDTFTKCKSYSKKKAVGLLSVADINNSKNDAGINNIDFPNNNWTGNTNSNNKAIIVNSKAFENSSKKRNNIVKPVLNIKKNSSVSSGNGTISDPYILKDNKQVTKAGTKLSEGRTGEYFSYSGYLWRIISRENDGTTKVIMDDTIRRNNETYNTPYNNKKTVYYSTTEKDNIGYKLNNEINSYVKNKTFVKTKTEILDYTSDIKYNAKTNKKTYKSKFNLPNLYELYSTSINKDYWLLNYSKKNNNVCKMSYTGDIYCEKYNYSFEYGIRIVATVNKSAKIKSGTGTIDNPYTLAS